MEGRFRCRKKVVKRHCGLQVFRPCVVLVCVCVHVCVSHSVVSNGLQPPRPPSMGFPRQEHWSGLPFPFQGIFPTQGTNLGLLHCRQIPYHLSHQGSLALVVLFSNQNYPALWDTCILLTMRSKGRNFMPAYETNVQDTVLKHLEKKSFDKGFPQSPFMIGTFIST